MVLALHLSPLLRQEASSPSAPSSAPPPLLSPQTKWTLLTPGLQKDPSARPQRLHVAVQTSRLWEGWGCLCPSLPFSLLSLAALLPGTDSVAARGAWALRRSLCPLLGRGQGGAGEELGALPPHWAGSGRRGCRCARVGCRLCPDWSSGALAVMGRRSLPEGHDWHAAMVCLRPYLFSTRLLPPAPLRAWLGPVLSPSTIVWGIPFPWALGVRGHDIGTRGGSCYGQGAHMKRLTGLFGFYQCWVHTAERWPWGLPLWGQGPGRGEGGTQGWRTGWGIQICPCTLAPLPSQPCCSEPHGPPAPGLGLTSVPLLLQPGWLACVSQVLLPPPGRALVRPGG